MKTKPPTAARRSAHRALTPLKYLVLLIIAALFVAPLVFTIVASFKSEKQIFDDFASFWLAFVPYGTTTTNYDTVFNRIPFLRYFLNSSLIVVLTVIPGLLINSLGGFALARLRLPGRKVLLGFVLLVIIAPFEAILIPLFLLTNQLPWFDGSTSWTNTLHVQIIPFVADAFSVFLFYQFFRTIPRELDEAIAVDGGSAWTVYRHIVIPLSRPVFVTAAILHGFGLWSSYLWPQMVTRDEFSRPLTVGILNFYGGPLPEWGLILAYSVLALIPVLILFFAAQRVFTESFAGTGIK